MQKTISEQYRDSMEEVKNQSRCWKIVSALFSVCCPKMQIAFYQEPSSYILAWQNLASIHASAERESHKCQHTAVWIL